MSWMWIAIVVAGAVAFLGGFELIKEGAAEITGLVISLIGFAMVIAGFHWGIP